MVFCTNSASGPIIEDCKQMYFAPVSPFASSVNSFVNKWSDVQDFNWLKKQKSPNWDLLPGPLFPTTVRKQDATSSGSHSTDVSAIQLWLKDGTLPVEAAQATAVEEAVDSDDEI